MSDRYDPLLAHRSRFPVLATTNYLISNSLGAVPSDAAKHLQDYYETWATRGVRAWEETWWEMAAGLGDRLAPLIGARPGEVVFQPNVTLAHAVIFSAFVFPGDRPKIVSDSMHFPSVLYLIAGLRGADVVVVPTDDGVTIDTNRLLEAIDERTAFVNISHVLFRSSFIHDVEAVTVRAREVGAVSIIDGYQSVGNMPVDVRALGVDVFIGGCLKWLCGGPGAAFMWVRPDLRRDLDPRLTGWMAHPRPFAFEPTRELRDDAWRFLHGTPNIAALYAARPGIEIIREVGMEAIRRKSIRQTTRLLDLALGRGWTVTTPSAPERRGGTVSIDLPHGLEVSKALKAREVLCDYRPGAGVRFSPHFYTTDEEIEAAIDAMAEVIDRSLWTRHAGARATVT